MPRGRRKPNSTKKRERQVEKQEVETALPERPQRPQSVKRMTKCCSGNNERIEVPQAAVDKAVEVIEIAAHELGWAECFVVAEELLMEYAVKYDPDGEGMEFHLSGLQTVAYAAALRARSLWMEQFA